MKFIGQHIVDLIARFRSDVYLEDVSDGTVANDKFLGLDSNNKIVKETITSSSGDITGANIDSDGIGLVFTSGDIDFTIAGGNAITTAGSSGGGTNAITINHDDTSSQASVNNSGSTFIQDVTIDTYGHVTGLTSAAVPTLNQDTTGSAATLTTARNIAGVAFDGSADISLNNNAITNGAGYTTNTGDITGVRLTADDSNIASSTSGSADFTIAGGEGIDTSVSGTTITIAGELATTSNLGVASFNSANFAVADGAVTIKDEGVDLTAEVTGVLPTANQKHIMHFQFMGYSIGDGSNYEAPQPLTDGQAPFEHADTSSADGLTITSGNSTTNVSEFIRMGGHVMVRAGTLKKWKGWTSVNHNNSTAAYIALFKWSPVENDSTDISASHGGLTKLVEATVEGKTNDKVFALEETSFTATVAEGDIIFTQVKTTSASKTVYFNTTLEIEM